MNFDEPDTDITVVSDVRKHLNAATVEDDPPTNVGFDQPTGVTSATALTDLHRSKVPADDPRLKLERPTSRTLRAGPVIGIAIGLLAIVLVAMAAASSSDPPPAVKSGTTEPEISTTSPVTLPDVLRDPEPTEAPPHDPKPSTPYPTDPVSSTQAPAANGGPSPSAQRAETFRQARFEEFTRARSAAILVAIDDTGAEPAQERPSAGATPDVSAEIAKATAQARATGSPSEGTRTADQNMQEHKSDFLAKTGGSEYLEKSLTTPRSPYELKAGTVIPTVLITGINSDLPGQVVGQVRENVYDTVTGNYLLIPQGSRVLASYDSMVSWGHERVLVCWSRVIRPDGSSLSIDCQPGVDLAGYAGFADEVDNHWWKIISGAAFSSLLAATAARSQGDVTTFQPSFPQQWASGAAGQINQVGQQITAKNLQIQPTITVRPGFTVNVLVTKDIVLSPYSP